MDTDEYSKVHLGRCLLQFSVTNKGGDIIHYMCINDYPKIQIGSIKTNKNGLHLRAKIWTVNLITPQVALAVVCPLKRWCCCCLFTIFRGSGRSVRALYFYTVI